MSALPTLALARVNVTDVVGNSGSDGNALLTPLIRIGAIFAGRRKEGAEEGYCNLALKDGKNRRGTMTQPLHFEEDAARFRPQTQDGSK